MRYLGLPLFVLLAVCDRPAPSPTVAPTPSPTARPEDQPYTAAAVLDMFRAGGLAVAGVQRFHTGDDPAWRISEQQSFVLSIAGTPAASPQAAAVVVIFADRRAADRFRREVLAGGAPAQVYTSGNAIVYLPVPAPAAVVVRIDRALPNWEAVPSR